MTNFHKRFNAIEVLHSEDNILTDRSDIEEHIVQFFDNLLTEQYLLRPKADVLIFDMIDQSCAD